MADRAAQVLTALAAEPTFRTIDRLSIRFVHAWRYSWFAAARKRRQVRVRVPHPQRRRGTTCSRNTASGEQTGVTSLSLTRSTRSHTHSSPG